MRGPAQPQGGEDAEHRQTGDDGEGRLPAEPRNQQPCQRHADQPRAGPRQLGDPQRPPAALVGHGIAHVGLRRRIVRRLAEPQQHERDQRHAETGRDRDERRARGQESQPAQHHDAAIAPVGEPAVERAGDPGQRADAHQQRGRLQRQTEPPADGGEERVNDAKLRVDQQARIENGRQDASHLRRRRRSSPAQPATGDRRWRCGRCADAAPPVSRAAALPAAVTRRSARPGRRSGPGMPGSLAAGTSNA